MEDAVVAGLKQKWIASGSCQDEQAYLAARARQSDSQFVFLDPDGTLPPWLAVIIRRETGVVYANQAAGVATEERLAEGFLVLLGGWSYDVDAGRIDLAALNDVFHEGDACMWAWRGLDLPGDRLAKLHALISGIPLWLYGPGGDHSKFSLRIDTRRLDELAEAWIPLETPAGPGVLVYKNCD